MGQGQKVWGLSTQRWLRPHPLRVVALLETPWARYFRIFYPTVDRRSNRLIVISCLDNLLKGAAGHATPNMNVMSGLPDEEGLKRPALYP